MTKLIYSVIVSLIFIDNIKCQNIFLEDINGDKKADILSITSENMKDIKIKQLYSGRKIWKFDYLNEFDFSGSNTFDSYNVADITGNGLANLLTFKDDGNNKNVWFFSIEPDKISYLGHTLLPNASGTIEYFADIDGDHKKELVLVKNEGTNKYIYTYGYNGGDFYLTDSMTSTGNTGQEHFADITGDGKDDLILSQDYGADKRLWTFKSNGTTFEYLAYTNLVSNSGKEVSFMNSNSSKDNFVDLVLSKNTSDGKKLWLFESDGARFNYEITNTLSDGNNREMLFGDINGNGTDDLIATNTINDIWSYENKGNVLTYKLHSYLSFAKIIPTNRSVDWNNAGYKSGRAIPNSFEHYVYMPPPNANPNTNYSNFQAKLNEAVSLKSSYPNEHIVIKFQSGTYSFNRQIVLNIFNNHSYIVLQGQGIKTASGINQYTELVYDIDPKYTEYANHFINIRGSRMYPTNTSEAPIVLYYNEESNEITLDKSLGIPDGQEYLVELLFTNGKWHEQPNIPKDSIQPNEYVGFISSANLISGTTYKLQKDFNLSWKLFKDETNNTKTYKFIPIKEIGLTDLSIRYNDEFENVNKDSITSTLVSIDRAQNCWINNIEISKVLSAAVGIGESQYVEVRNSYFHEAYGYGGGGRGYGVVVGSRSIHCKVENNVFRKFRHAMMVVHGSNRNVFGYNYSREQTDQLGNILGDLNLHGFYPYANLFEGNRVDRIHADAYWGPNGSLNTFFRNYTYHNQLRIDRMLNANIIGNENALVTGNDQTTFEFRNYIYGVYNETNLVEQYLYLPDKSYYLDEMPIFFDNYINSKVSWPAIGPPLLVNQLLQNIPARERWFNSLGNYNLKSSIAEDRIIVKREVTIYPNPYDSGVLTLKINSQFRTCDIKIYTTDGQLIVKKDNLEISNNKDLNIDLSNFKKGLYLISIITTDRVFTEKLIIK